MCINIYIHTCVCVYKHAIHYIHMCKYKRLQLRICSIYVCEEVINTKKETRMANAIHNRRGRELYTAVANKYLTSVSP